MVSRTGLLAFSLVVFLYIPASVHATEVHVWSKSFGSVGSDVVTDLDWSHVEGQGGLITGSFEDTVTFGGTPLVSAGGSDVFLVRLDGNGNHVWSRRMGGPGNDVAYAVWSNSQIVVGSFEGTANFGGADLVSAGGTDIFIAKYGAGGVHISSTRFGGPLDDACLDISDGTIGGTPFVVTGFFNGTVNFGGNDLTSVGGSDIFVVRFDPFFAHMWSHRYGGPLDDVGCAIVTNSTTAIIVGSFGGTANFGGTDITSAGGKDAFFAQYTLAGAHERSAGFGGSGDDFGTAVARTSAYFYFTGAFHENANFGGEPLSSYGGSDIFVAAFTTAGAHQWSKRLGGPLDDFGNGIAHNGNIVAVTGTFSGTANLGGGPRTSTGGTDIFLAKFEWDDGFHRSSQAFGGPLDDIGTAVGMHVSFIPEDYGRDPVLVGSFRGAVDFGGETLTSEGETDAFVLDLSDAFTGVGDVPQKGSVAVSCFPNPFNPRTSIIYTVPATAPVTVVVYDPNGAHVATLVNREHRNAGEHRVEWDGRADVGGLAASGIYFVRVEQLGVASATKLVLLK